MHKVPLWAYFPSAALLLWVGLALMSPLMGSKTAVDAERAELLQQAPVWVLILVPVGEALLWTVAFVEVAAYFRAAAFGAIAGVAAYSLVTHSGFWGIVVSAWIGAVLNTCYILMRGRSRPAAIANAIGLRWAFIAYAYFTVAGTVQRAAA